MMTTIFDLKDLDTAKELYGARSKRRSCYIRFNCKSCNNETQTQLRIFMEGEPLLLCRKCKCKINGANGAWSKHDVWTPEIREKRKQTCQERYGVDAAVKIPGIVEKGIKASHSKEAREKRKKTFYERFGGPSPLFSDEVKSKAHWGYYFEDIHFDSSYELAYYIWLRDNEKSFIYHPDIHFDYKDEFGKQHEYCPDFLIEGKFYEIKGSQFFNEKDEPYNKYLKSFWWEKYNALKENGVTILREKDLKEPLEYCHKKYGKKYLKSFKRKKND